MVGRKTDTRRIVHQRMRPLANAALVRDRGVEDREEWLAGLAVPPMRLRRRLVPHVGGLGQVVVLLDVVGRVVAACSQISGEQAHRLGQPGHAAHVLRSGGRGIEARDDRGAGRRTDRRVRPRVPEEEPARRQPIEIRRRAVAIAVCAEVRAVVFARNPEDVGQVHWRLGGRRAWHHGEQPPCGDDDPPAHWHGAGQ